LFKTKIIVLILLLFCIINASIFIGKYSINTQEYILFIKSILSGDPLLDPSKYEILKGVILNIRLPRIITAVMIGSALAISGAVFQAMFVNPLVSPGILGVLSGASFGAALGMVLGFGWFWINAFTFIFGFGAVLSALGISLLYSKSQNMIILVLGWVISSALFGALLSIIKYSADPYDTLPAITYWLMGSLSFSSPSTVWKLFLPMILGMLFLIWLSKYLNALSLGDEEAKALGVNTKAVKLSVILFATLISALSVVLAGIIGWIGLIIPHITRLLFGADNKKIILASGIIGAIFLLIVDDFSRIIFTFEIPIGILTSIIGIPIFITVLKNAKKGF
jgi:iron complex transport system permease protein